MCYLDARELEHVDDKDALLNAFTEKYHGNSATYPVAFCANIEQSGLSEIQESALRFLEQGPAQRFLYSSICSRLVGPSDTHADLSNLVEACHLARGIEFFRRPVKRVDAAERCASSSTVGDLLGLDVDSVDTQEEKVSTLAPPCSISSHTKGSDSNAAAIDALVFHGWAGSHTKS